MKKLLVLTVTLLSAQFSFASVNVKPGNYEGATAAGETCRVTIDAERVSVSYKPNGRPWDAFSASRANANESLNDGVYSASASDEAVQMTVKANVAKDGTLINATFRMGFIFAMTGHKVECLNLQSKVD